MGFDESRQRARFFLTDTEITKQMKGFEKEYGHNASLFAHKWVEMNLLHPQVVSRVSPIHLSDCRVKTDEFFRNGRLTGRYYDEIRGLKDPLEQEDYSVNIVLKHYDSHEPLGVTLRHFPQMSSIV